MAVFGDNNVSLRESTGNARSYACGGTIRHTGLEDIGPIVEVNISDRIGSIASLAVGRKQRQVIAEPDIQCQPVGHLPFIHNVTAVSVLAQHRRYRISAGAVGSCADKERGHGIAGAGYLLWIRRLINRKYNLVGSVADVKGVVLKIETCG